MIRLDLNVEDLEDSGKRAQIVNTILYLQLGLGVNSRRRYVEKRTKRYYGKKGGSLYDFNLDKPLIDTAVRTFIGDLPDITTRKDDEKEKQRISAFTQKLYSKGFAKHISETAKNGAISGSGFLLLYHNDGDTFTSFRFLEPKYTNVVCDCSVAERPLFAFNIVEVNDLNSGNGTIKYNIYVYTKDKIYAYQTNSGVSFRTISSAVVTPLNVFCVTPIGINVTERQKVNEIEHDYKDIPIIEFPNNYERLGDTDSVEQLIDLYEKLQNNRNANVEDVLRYILLLKNVRIGNEEEQQKMKTMLQDNRVLPIEGDNADAKMLTNTLNQTDLETLAKSIKENIHYICHIPDLTSVDFSQNASDPIIKIKTKPLLDLCLQKETWFTEPLIKVIDLALDFARTSKDEDYNKYKFDISNITLRYSHTLPSNDIDATNMAVNLLNAGVGAPRELLQNIKAIGNVDDYMAEMYKWLDYIDKRKERNKNISKESGLNDTNLERQNKEPITREQMDNMKNFVKGQAEKITDEKVE